MADEWTVKDWCEWYDTLIERGMPSHPWIESEGGELFLNGVNAQAWDIVVPDLIAMHANRWVWDTAPRPSSQYRHKLEGGDPVEIVLAILDITQGWGTNG